MICKMCDKTTSSVRGLSASRVVEAAKRGTVPSQLEASLWFSPQQVWAQKVGVAEQNPSHEFDVCSTCYSELS